MAEFAVSDTVVDRQALTVTFTVDLDLDMDSVPAPGAFRVTVNDARRNVAAGGVAISGKTVRLTLASTVSEGDTVRVQYTKPSADPLQGASGSTVDTFGDRSVTNNSVEGTIWSATLTVGSPGGTNNGCGLGGAVVNQCDRLLPTLVLHLRKQRLRSTLSPALWGTSSILGWRST